MAQPPPIVTVNKVDDGNGGFTYKLQITRPEPESREPFVSQSGTCCPYFLRDSCDFDGDCHYAHDKSKPSAFCQDYQTGECLYGDQCYFRHELMRSGLPPKASLAPTSELWTRPVQPPPPPQLTMPTPQDYVTSLIRFKDHICKTEGIDVSIAQLTDGEKLVAAWETTFKKACSMCLEERDKNLDFSFFRVSWRHFPSEWTPEMWRQVAQECQTQGLVQWQDPATQPDDARRMTGIFLQGLIGLVKNIAYDEFEDSDDWKEDIEDRRLPRSYWQFPRMRGEIMAGAAGQDLKLAKKLLKNHVWGLPRLFPTATMADYGSRFREKLPIDCPKDVLLADVFTWAICGASQAELIGYVSKAFPEECFDWGARQLCDVAFAAVIRACRALIWSSEELKDPEEIALKIGKFAWDLIAKAALPYLAQDKRILQFNYSSWAILVCDLLKEVHSELNLCCDYDGANAFWKAAFDGHLHPSDHARVAEWMAEKFKSDERCRESSKMYNKERSKAARMLKEGPTVLSKEEFLEECKSTPAARKLEALTYSWNAKQAENDSIAAAYLSSAPRTKVPWPRTFDHGEHVLLDSPSAFDELLCRPASIKFKICAIALGPRFEVENKHVDAITSRFGAQLELLTMGDIDTATGRGLTDIAVDFITARCPNLVELQLNAAGNITDAAFRKILDELPCLQVLALTGSGSYHGELTKIGFRVLLDRRIAPLLEKVYIMNQDIEQELVDEVIRASNLRIMAGETAGYSMAKLKARKERGLGWGGNLYGNIADPCASHWDDDDFYYYTRY